KICWATNSRFPYWTHENRLAGPKGPNKIGNSPSTLTRIFISVDDFSQRQYSRHPAPSSILEPRYKLMEFERLGYVLHRQDTRMHKRRRASVVGL
ncbi:hypothetical protein BC938DRAFT_480414, partial [Jimgerdemannia flammicorona]